MSINLGGRPRPRGGKAGAGAPVDKFWNAFGEGGIGAAPEGSDLEAASARHSLGSSSRLTLGDSGEALGRGRARAETCMSASCDGCVGSRPPVHLASGYSLADLLVLEMRMGTQCWTEDQRRWSSLWPWSHLSSGNRRCPEPSCANEPPPWESTPGPIPSGQGGLAGGREAVHPTARLGPLGTRGHWCWVQQPPGPGPRGGWLLHSRRTLSCRD